MGLFKRLKKKTGFDDIDPLDINGLVKAYTSQNSTASDADIANCIKRLAEPNADQERLTSEGELPWGWLSIHKEETSIYTTEYNAFWTAWYDSRSKAPSEQLTALEAFVNYMNMVKTSLVKKGECFNYWRDTLFDDDYLAKRTCELNELKENFEALEQDYSTKKAFEKNILPTLEHSVFEIIKEHPGILQKDIYKKFPLEAKPYIQEKLYYAEKLGQLKREKHGSSYSLFFEQK